MNRSRSRGSLGLALAVIGCAVVLFPASAPATTATLPFHDDFDYPVVSPWWTPSGTAPAPLPPPQPVSWWYRNLDTCGPPSGTYHLVLDSNVVGTYNRNELTLTVDLAGKNNVWLTFLAKSFADTPDPLTPWAAYTGSKNYDGVAVSPDGAAWYPVLSLTEDDGLTRSYEQFTLSLDAALATWGISYTPAFRIRFNHYGNGQVVGASGNSGIGIDAVSVYESVPPDADFGDAPAPYPTLLADNGARHTVTGPTLGAARDASADGQPSADASGDSTDEDGVVFVGQLVPGQAAAVRVSASAPAFLDGWIDFNGNGSWADADEQVFVSTPLATGDNNLAVSVPAGALVSDRVFARLRLGTAGGLSFDGAAADGEVEDYRVAVVPAAPVMDSEPALTPGTANTVSWTPVAQADSYYAECSQTVDFSAIFQSSGWVCASSHTFAGLADVAQYYRVRAARSVAGGTASWNQTEDAEFSLCTLSGTALYGGGQVSLLGPAVNTDSVGGASEELKATASATGRLNVFLPSQDVQLKGFSMLLSRDSAMDVEFAVYEGGSVLADSYTKRYSQTVHVGPGLDFLSVDGLSLMLNAGTHYALGVVWSGTAASYKAYTGTTVSFGTSAGRAQSVNYPGDATLTMTQANLAPGGMYFMRVKTANTAPFAAFGETVSPAISPSTWFGWRTLDYSISTPPGTAVTVDVLPETGSTPVAGWSDLVPGTDLSALSAAPIRLRARLSTSDTAVTPALLDWGVSWQAEADRLVQGPWSAPVMSTQDGLAPFAASVTPADPNPARTPTVKFLVQYSEAVTGVALAAPFADFAVRAGSVSGAAVIAVTQTDPARYLVEVATGGTDGTVAIDALTGGAIRDLSGNPLAAGCATGAAYTLDYTPPTVAGIVPLDPSPTNAPIVRFGVTFSEPVTGVPDSAPFTGFNPTGLAGASATSITAGGAACTVSVQTGALDGMLHLTVDTSGQIQDMAGWPLAAGLVSTAGYQISHLRFTAVPPSLITVSSGNPCAMSVAVTGGTGPRIYQWHFNEAPLSGENGSSLEISGVTLDDGGAYYCEVTDAHETIQSPRTLLQVQSVLPIAGMTAFLMLSAMLAVAGVRRSGKAMFWNRM